MESIVSAFSLEYLFTTLLYTVMGFAFHVMKKNFSDGISWKRYLMENRMRTKLAIGVGLFSYGNLLLFHPNAAPHEFAAIGYIIDSVFNKAPLPDQEQVVLESLEQKVRETKELDTENT